MHKDVRNRGRIAVAVAIVSASAIALSGCSATAGSSGSNKTLTLALQGQLQSFDPWSAPNGLNGSVWGQGAVYDTLTRLDSSAKPTPNLATSWTNPDPAHYTLKLRSDVKFTDGSKFDAQAVVDNLTYAQTAKQPGECNGYVAGITATAVNTSTVSLVLKTPNPDLLTDFGTCAGFMVSPKALKNPTTLAQTPAGSGPYTYDKAKSRAGQLWVFDRNPNYWNKSAYKYATIKEQFFSDTNAAANAAKTGQVDVIQSVDAKTDTSGLDHLLSAPQEFRGLYFTDVTGKIAKALGDVRVRQAFNYAIDRDTIVKQVYGASGAVAYSTPFPKGTPGYSDALANRYPYDPAKAKQLLADAGYSSGLKVTLLDFPGLTGTMAQAIAGDLGKVGVTMSISDHNSDFITQMLSGKWAMTSGNFTLSSSEYHNLVGLATASAYFNPLKNSDPVVDGLLAKVAASTDKAQQVQLYQQIATRIQEQAWFLVPVIVKSATAYSKKTVKVTGTPGIAFPLLADITPAS